MPEPVQVLTEGSVTSGLTDGTGISKLVGSKIVKDLVLDFLMSVGPAFLLINVNDLNGVLAAPVAAGIAAADAGIRVIVRALIRWAQTP